ncbi:GH1 family beta-glucosidase [Deinococcus sp. JMULE3]|uniref:GH1 family beta-glucosidase n=1 Tax=Deinococcus sp. JMULE3 TaxID=2518341 RepID=UPI001575D96E|nr:GH1 family beta-glucosidase [Deinococcus sp. JMULE3]NTY01099.1 beta-glucosidase [Deinococcus sp. JMULE3]
MTGFPDGFVWGVATSAYQIEGAVQEGGRGVSVWDTFSHAPGRTRGGATGDVTCDHFHRFPEDVALLRELGVGAYRFSVAWPRVQPGGRGRANPAGVAFYDRLVDELLGAGVQPWVTLHHWDLPQELEDAGGWLSRDTAYRFEEYAFLVGERLADRAAAFMTLNAPSVVMLRGYAHGTHAPGRTLGLGVFPAAHHQLLAHGLAARALREAGARQVGIANQYAPALPATDRDADVQAAALMDALHNHLFTDPLLRAAYPAPVLDLLREHAPQLLEAVRPGDLDVIAAPLDVLGVNDAPPDWVRVDPRRPFGAARNAVPEDEATRAGSLTQTLLDLKARHGDACPPLVVTGRGCALPDTPDADGRVRDAARIRSLEAHIEATRLAVQKGAPVTGYLAWTLMDNFEWADGFDQRFGLVHVDFGTQVRTRKDSFSWCQAWLREQA